MDDINTNKQFRLYDKNKKYIRLSVDETIARNLNNWKGWKCSAGVRALYIDYDGNIWMCNSSSAYQTDNFNYDKWLKFSATHREKYSSEEDWQKAKPTYAKTFRKMKEAYTNIMLPATELTYAAKKGYLGNITDGFKKITEWPVCPWNKCGCGADVILSKHKFDEHKSILDVTNYSWQGKEKTLDNCVDSVNEIIAVEMNFPIPYQILWDLGRKCNYDCSYCWPNVHNRHEPHKKFDDIKKTCEDIINNWSKGEAIRWNFGGGEPTLHPNFLDLLTYLKDRNQWTMVTSNGTRDHKYWKLAVKNLNSINLSAHFDGLKDFDDETRFINNIKVICEHFSEHDDDHWLEVKLMASPNHFERALTLRNRINEMDLLGKLGANGRINGVLSLVPIRSFGDSGEIVKYTDHQLSIFANQ